MFVKTNFRWLRENPNLNNMWINIALIILLYNMLCKLILHKKIVITLMNMQNRIIQVKTVMYLLKLYIVRKKPPSPRSVTGNNLRFHYTDCTPEIRGRRVVFFSWSLYVMHSFLILCAYSICKQCIELFIGCKHSSGLTKVRKTW